MFSTLFFSVACLGQKTFHLEFTHGENDKYFGKLYYQIYVQQKGQETPSDSRELTLIPELAEEVIKVKVLVTGVDLAYKDKGLNPKSQDREAEVFYIGFEPPRAPLLGEVFYTSVPKIFDKNTNVGATQTEVVFAFTCNNSTAARSNINISFKCYFAPRGRTEVIDSRDHQINIPIKIEIPKSVFDQEVRFQEAYAKAQQLAAEVEQDPKRRNKVTAEKLRQFLNEYQDIKHEGMKALADFLRQYENREDGPEDVYGRITNYQNAALLQKASGDISLYINNCIQQVWDYCPHLEEVRYLEIKTGKGDTTLIKGFMNQYPSSPYNGELFGILSNARSRNQRGGGGGYSGSSSYQGSSGYNSQSGVGENTEALEEDYSDTLEIIKEPPGAIVEYNETLRRITIEKTGDWETATYTFELVGLMGRQGEKLIGADKLRTLYIDDMDVRGDEYRFEVYIKDVSGRKQLIDDNVRFVLEEKGFDIKYIGYGLLALLLGGLYWLYQKYVKL